MEENLHRVAHLAEGRSKSEILRTARKLLILADCARFFCIAQEYRGMAAHLVACAAESEG